MAKWLYSIGSFAARRAWAVIAIWVLVIAGVAGSYSAFHGQLKTTFTMPGTETQRLTDELSNRYPDANRGNGQIVVKTDNGSAITEEQKQAFITTLNSLKDENSAVDAVSDPFATEQQIADGKNSLTRANLSSTPHRSASRTARNSSKKPVNSLKTVKSSWMPHKNNSTKPANKPKRLAL